MKKIILAICTVVLFLLLSVQELRAQNPNTSVVIPPSPTAASLGVYGEIPVSNYTGQPSIRIPIYELDAKGFKVPIVLDYRLSAVKVEEEASWVGLGWSLSAGGLITRSVRGLDDIPTEGNVVGFPFLSMPEVGEDNIYTDADQPKDLALALGAMSKQRDTEPDMFYFNFLGYSGKFILKKLENPSAPLEVILISQQKMSIDVTRNHQLDTYEWTITTADGNRFIFRNPEKTKSYTQTVSGLDWEGDPVEQYPTTVTSSWYLSQINTNNGEIITFNYTEPSANGSRRALLKSERYMHYLNGHDLNPSVSCGPTDCQNNTHYYTNTLLVNYDIYLKSIEYKGISIDFSTDVRTDMLPFTELHVTNSLPQKLSRITINRVSGSHNEIFKFFDFQTDYFNSGSGLGGSDSKRLKLMSVTERTPTESMRPFVFSYNSRNGIEIADKNSKSKDHWGYYNGKDNRNITNMGVSKSTTIPLITVTHPTTGATLHLNGANREPDTEFSKIGTLSKIKYPTGGFSEFNYESHDYYQEAEYVTLTHKERLHKNGELIMNPDGPDVANYTLNLTQRTLIEFLVASYNTSSLCYVETGIRRVASIINASTNTPIHIDLNIGCNRMDRTNYITELPAGTYNLVVYATSYFVTEATITWKEQTSSPLLAKQGGGLRIKSIKKSDGVSQNEVVTNYSYIVNDGLNDISSGRLMTPLVYDYLWYIYSQRSCTILGGGYEDDYQCYYNFSESAPNIPLSTSANGSPVGYSSVTVEITDGISASAGKTVYSYINEPDIFEFRYLPTVPNQSNGFMTKKAEFRKEGNGDYTKVRELDVFYSRDAATRERVTGLKVMMPEGDPKRNETFLHFKFYSIFSEWWYKTEEVSRDYPLGPNMPGLVKSVEYFYENPIHKLATKYIYYNSEGTKVIKKHFRPADYGAGIDPVLDEMAGFAFMHDKIVEEVIETESQGQVKTNSATFTKYDFGSLFVVPTVSYNLSIETPKANFVSSLSSGLVNDPDYIEVERYIYDPWYSNLAEIVRKNKQHTAFIWGYGALYPIAKIENATMTDIENVIDSQDLALFGETNPTDQELMNFFAPLRSHPLLKDALITTYTYKPLIGVTSITDPKGMTMYYEYDGFGRLKGEKDHHGKVLKAYDYHYRGQ